MAQVLFAGAAITATLTLLSAASPGSAETAVASGSVRATAFVDDDTGGGVNDQGQTSGDIFTQNAQDQSTA